MHTGNPTYAPGCHVTEDEVLTTEEVAQYLKMKEQTVRDLLRLRKLPGRKIGKSWRVLRSELEAWLRQSEPSAAEEEK
ncbi:MAG: helix-turn-helix domain-containing protein [Anaerolineae bacterium]